jgi:hypothetical protein
MKIITLCGSLEFQKEMMKVAEKNGVRRILRSYTSISSIRGY